MEHPWEGGTKVYINGPGHMTKLAAMLKTLKNLLLQNHWANRLETWHVASGSVVLDIFNSLLSLSLLLALASKLPINILF